MKNCATCRWEPHWLPDIWCKKDDEEVKELYGLCEVPASMILLPVGVAAIKWARVPLYFDRKKKLAFDVEVLENKTEKRLVDNCPYWKEKKANAS